MSSVYSFGEESPLKFKIPDKTAELYNQAAEQFFKSQVRFNQKFGRQWDPTTDPIEVGWTRKQRKAWNDFAKIFDKTVKTQGPYHVNDIMDDFLVKNVASTAAVAAEKWGAAITTSARVGALYVLLRGL